MTKEEYDRLNAEEKETVVRIKASDFTKNKKDRTLLYGYDIKKNTHHVYLINGNVRRWDKANANEEYELLNEFTSYNQLVPNKRLYPERCDYDFCVYLKSKGVKLLFTPYREEPTNKNKTSQFYGEVM